MLEPRYVAPSFRLNNFNCPHCGVRAPQYWGTARERRIEKRGLPVDWTSIDLVRFRTNLDKDENMDSEEKERRFSTIERASRNEVFLAPKHDDVYCYNIYNLLTTLCDHCGDIAIWLKGSMIHPLSGDIPAHIDLPAAVNDTFVEASRIVDLSPRASAALARLAIQQLCIELGCTAKKTLDEQIGELVTKGLDPSVSQMLDGVRVIGNNAVHPGEIDMKDDRDTARFLLECINRIVQRLITEDRQSAELFDKLPQGVKDAITKRNNKATTLSTSTPAKP
jgi:hypothetical protein